MTQSQIVSSDPAFNTKETGARAGIPMLTELDATQLKQVGGGLSVYGIATPAEHCVICPLINNA